MPFRMFCAALWILSLLFVLLLLAVQIAPGLTQYLGPIASVFELLLSILDRGDSITKITIALIFSLFAWALLELAWRCALVAQEDLEVTRLSGLLSDQSVQNSQIRDFLSSLGHSERLVWWPPTRASRRAELIAERPSNIGEALPASAVIDAGDMSGLYRPLQVYAWILPVLGFVGTASGMATSIEGFSAALAGTTDTQNIIGVLSAKVIPGLTSAFQTTMFALAASVVVHACATALRGWDQQLLDQLDRMSLRFLPAPQVRDMPGAELASIVAALEGVVSQLEGFREAANNLNASSDALAAAAMQMKEIGKELESLVSSTYVLKIERQVDK